MELKVELTPRLQAVASHVPQGARLADVGTDHAYLPVSLLLEGRIPSAVATDLRPGPLDRARLTASTYGCTDRISFHLCDGLADVQPDEVDTVAIAGMGGETISNILAAASWIKEKHLTVILQPMSTQTELRRWLWQNGYQIQCEDIVCESDTLYVVIAASAGPAVPISPAEEWAGRQNREDDAPLRGQYLDSLLEKVDRAMKGIALSREGRTSPKYQELEQVRTGLAKMREEWRKWHP